MLTWLLVGTLIKNTPLKSTEVSLYKDILSKSIVNYHLNANLKKGNIEVTRTVNK